MSGFLSAGPVRKGRAVHGMMPGAGARTGRSALPVTRQPAAVDDQQSSVDPQPPSVILGVVGRCFCTAFAGEYFPFWPVWVAWPV